MANLTAKQESFINLMTENDELARRGFLLLLKQADFEGFFDALSEKKLFDATHNPTPVPADERGFFHIPYWSALDYLAAVAKKSGDQGDLQLANKVMEVIRSVSNWRDSEGNPRENFHTWRKFAEILGLVPTAVITFQDVDFVEIWIKDKFDQGMVANALDEGALSRFLVSSSLEDWKKAVAVLRHCTIIHWAATKEIGETEKRPLAVTHGYWLRKLLSNHAKSFGTKIGQQAAEILVERVREVYSSESRRLYSRIYRPAIENHAQNHDWHEAENIPIEGLREVLLSWCDHDLAGAKTFVESLLNDELEILRRVGIYVLGQQWTGLRQLYLPLVGPTFFSSGNIHEAYNLLKSHFADLTEDEKTATVEAIRHLQPPAKSDDPVRSLKRSQMRWLSAIAGKGHAPSDQWFEELRSDATAGRLSEHPDFDTYIQVTSGSGPAPYSAQELIALAKAGIIIEKLNTFQPQDRWRGPTIEGFVSAFEEAVKIAPETFLQLLPELLKTTRPFQHSVIWGLKLAWDATEGKEVEFDWNDGWKRLILFFEQLIGAPEFWNETVTEKDDLVPTRDWIPAAIAEFLNAGTRNDNRAYPSELLPRGQSLIKVLLENVKPADEPSDDTMFYALNSPKGKAIEALFSHALRLCRLGDKANGSHLEAWTAIKSLFEAELEKCQNTNYEFSTLAGGYLAQLDYMNPEWVKVNVGRVFPSEFPLNSICAIDGLAYTPFTLSVYRLLAEHGILDRGLKYELRGPNAHEKLLERIAAAYVWGEETLESSRFSHLFKFGRPEDLEIVARFFPTLNIDDLKNDQKERIIQYWDRCIAAIHTSLPTSLLSTLSLLSSYLTSADGEDRQRLETVAPHVHVGHNMEGFVEELARLAEVSPDGVSIVLGKMIQGRVPEYDFEDRLKLLLEKLVEKGKKQDVIQYVNQLRILPGMQDLYNRLTQN